MSDRETTLGARLVLWAANPTSVPGIWMVWDAYAGLDAAGVPLRQCFTGSMEAAGMVADAMNAREGTATWPTR